MTSKFFPLHAHSHYSLLDGLSKPDQFTRRLVECGHAGSALTDHGTVSGAAAYMKAAKETCKCGHQKKAHSSTRCAVAGCPCGGFDKAALKPILGSEFYLCQKPAEDRSKENAQLSHLCVLAKNREGWKALIRATSAANRPEHFYRKPRLDLDKLAAIAGGNCIAFSGHPGSDLANCLFTDWRQAYSATSYEEARGYVRDDWKKVATELACRYRDLFGKENFSLEVQRIDKDNMPAVEVIVHGMRIISRLTGIPCVATADSHYPTKAHANDHQVLLCSALDTTLKEVNQKREAGEDVGLSAFFRSKRFHIPTSEEMEAIHTPEELARTLQIAEMCETYDILGQPMLPQFPCPDGLTADDFIRRLCEEGWRRKLGPRMNGGMIAGLRGAATACWEPIPCYEESVYRERLTKELGVIFGAGLSGYFLIVRDYCNFARSNGWKVGKGRGSAAGCLVSYLLGITDVDPIVYGLMFERFYNHGRNAPGRIALPDIDVDFEKYRRPDILAYCKKTYGASRVAQMDTFNRMQGRGAVKDVLKVTGAASFEEANQITEFIPQESSVSDQLQEMMEETGEASIIRWALENEAEGLKPWVQLNPDGSLSGRLAREFSQAMRLEGTFRSRGKHPSGLIISAVDLADIVPMRYDKTADEMVVAVDMRDAENMGLVKFDILGTVVLDKIRCCQESLRTGKIA